MEEFRRDDIVFLWMGGPPEVRGLYGWGRIVSDAPRYYKDWGYGIDVQYENKFERHIPFNAVKTLPSFSDYVLFKTAIGTNFRLSDEQAADLKKLIAEVCGAGGAP
jgi:hypothetical protein